MELLKWGRWRVAQKGWDNPPSLCMRCWNHLGLKSPQWDGLILKSISVGVHAWSSVELPSLYRKPAFCKTKSQTSVFSPLTDTACPWQSVRLSYLCTLRLHKQTEVYKKKKRLNSSVSNKCLVVTLIKRITSSPQMIETLATIAPAISLSLRCGGAFSTQALINKGIAGWLKAAICPLWASIKPVTAHLSALISSDI